MSEDQTTIAELQAKLDKVVREQAEVGKLLIRRDLALSRANEKLKALDVAKSEFISVAAHQLRTPLSAMKWILSMLIQSEFKSEEEIKEFTGKAYESCQRMITLVNDLLEVDHIQSGKDQFIFDTVDLAPIVDNVLTESAAEVAKKKLNIHIETGKDSIVEGDAEKLRGLCQNLLENAIKYTPVSGDIFVSTKPEGRFILMSVKDTGIGIPEDTKSHIFSKFFRAHNAMKMDTVGSGLGLFIAKQIVERHGGTIWFESGTTGTTFSVLLPRPTHTGAV